MIYCVQQPVLGGIRSVDISYSTGGHETSSEDEPSKKL